MHQVLIFWSLQHLATLSLQPLFRSSTVEFFGEYFKSQMLAALIALFRLLLCLFKISGMKLAVSKNLVLLLIYRFTVAWNSGLWKLKIVKISKHLTLFLVFCSFLSNSALRWISIA